MIHSVFLMMLSVKLTHNIMFTLMAKNLVLISSVYRTISSWIQSLLHAFWKALAKISYDVFSLKAVSGEAPG